jgi:hypothetical protein
MEVLQGGGLHGRRRDDRVVRRDLDAALVLDRHRDDVAWSERAVDTLDLHALVAREESGGKGSLAFDDPHLVRLARGCRIETVEHENGSPILTHHETTLAGLERHGSSVGIGEKGGCLAFSLERGTCIV